jgi:hypothetical protein
VLRMLAKLRSTASKWLLIGGLALIGYGVFYWWKGFPYPVGIMLTYSALGCLVVGAGLLLRRPETTATLVLGTASFAASGTILLAVCLPYPISPPYLLLILVCAAGTLRGLLRLRWQSRNRTNQR